jgi:hypothetical protein
VQAFSCFTAEGKDGKIHRGLADVAQLVEQLIRNQQVTGSSPVVGSSGFGLSVQMRCFSHLVEKILRLHQIQYLFIHGIFIFPS